MSQLAVGDQVIISCITSCGHCSFWQQGIDAHCLGDEGASGIGWVFGHLIDGTHAEYLRVPYAETCAYKVPQNVTNQQACLRHPPTGCAIGGFSTGRSTRDVVAVVGAGPVGLAVIATAGLHRPARIIIIAIDPDTNRVEEAKRFGASRA